jgi:16S rRNA (cytosine967-C5)-methyltransferase
VPDSLVLNHAARVLESVAVDLPADAALRRHFQFAKRLRGGEKRMVSRAVFAFFRWREWLEPNASWQRQVESAVQLQERFEKDERSVKAEALAVRAVPAWLRDEMELPADYLRQLQRQPALWIRARPGTATALATELGRCTPDTRSEGVSLPAAPDALRFTGTQDLFLTPAFHRGAFEIQDLASQLVGLACAPQPGQTWWDACAGEGGKLLHLADQMANKGLIWATDRSERRIMVLRRRAARAKLFNFRTAGWDGSARLPSKTKFDGVLLDAPCSGVGTWQRNPHARWTTTARDVAELAASQTSMLGHIAPSVKPGGRLVYAVCTLTRSETHAVADAFAAAHPQFQPESVLGIGPRVTIWPHEVNANGMFIAAWRRTA